ncbi:MAG TPA: alpha/beta hydrolase, partial [Afifellaceae bacterium]|nr:alpha/beta hydrolase [Afifellaceae bacterium]
GVVLFFHGNAGNISHRLDSLRIFNALNLDTLIFDYRGYGRSDGKVSERGTYRDGEAAWRYLTVERGIAAEDIVLFGRSLGAAIATYVASRHTPGALIVESGFVSVPDMAANLYPWLPARRLARIKFPAGDYLRAVSCPVLIVHSRDDEIIPFEQGRKLFERALEPKHFLELRGGHNDGFLVSGRRYLDGLDNFLAASLDK